jgi:hypothetical protein
MASFPPPDRVGDLAYEGRTKPGRLSRPDSVGTVVRRPIEMSPPEQNGRLRKLGHLPSEHLSKMLQIDNVPKPGESLIHEEEGS